MVVGSKDRKWTARIPCMRFVAVEELRRLLLMQLEKLSRNHGIGVLEVISGELLFLKEPNLPVGAIGGPKNMVDAVDSLEIGANSIEAVGQLDRHRIEINAAALLEVGELRDFQAVQKHLPTDAPGTQRGRLPIVFLEAHIVIGKAQADGRQALQIQILHVGGSRF